MKLYEATIDTRDGENEYTEKLHFAAENDEQAAMMEKDLSFWLPSGKYDPAENLYTIPGDYRLWRWRGVREISAFHVPGVDTENVFIFNVTYRKMI